MLFMLIYDPKSALSDFPMLATFAETFPEIQLAFTFTFTITFYTLFIYISSDLD